MRSAALSVVLSAIALLAGASSARAEQQVSSQGSVTATFDFAQSEYPYGYTGLWLTISRDGQVLYEGVPSAGGCEEPSCFPGGYKRDSVRVRDLDGDDEPEVLLDLYTGGAHCCQWVRIFTFDGTGYRSFEHGFADAGYRLSDLDADGMLELVSSDTRFAYRFASFASSLFPVRIWAFDGARLVDVTDSFPERIRADAKSSWRLYRRWRRGDREPRGAIAAWAANHYRLGQRRSTLRTLRRLARHGQLPGSAYSARDRSQRRFVTDLDGFLRRLGY